MREHNITPSEKIVVAAAPAAPTLGCPPQSCEWPSMNALFRIGRTANNFLLECYSFLNLELNSGQNWIWIVNGIFVYLDRSKLFFTLLWKSTKSTRKAFSLSWFTLEYGICVPIWINLTLRKIDKKSQVHTAFLKPNTYAISRICYVICMLSHRKFCWVIKENDKNQINATPIDKSLLLEKSFK